MRGILALLAVASLALPVLAGCVEPMDPVDHATVNLTPVVSGPAPKVDAKAMLAEVKSFSEAFPKRNVDNEMHNAARKYLKEAFEKAGLENVTLDAFATATSPTSTPTGGLGEHRLVNVCAFHWGATKRDEWVVMGAHYDVTDGAVYGAYDDGSGTMMVQHLARAFATVPTERTLVFCNFDGEEQGLRGSRHMVEALLKEEWAYNGTVIAMVDFDMAGINWPAPPPLVADVVSPEMKAIIENKSRELGFPEGSVEYRPISGGSSDNGPFKAANISSVLFISDFDKVGLPVVGVLPDPVSSQVKYPFWHLLDTYEGMVQLAGGEENLVKGTQNVLDIASELILQLSGPVTPHFEAPARP